MLEDAVDSRIVACLLDDGRRSYADIGSEVGLSAPAVKRRTDRLRRDGVIVGFTARLGPAVGADATEAFVELYCRGRTSPRDIAAAVARIPQVVAAYTVSGEADALLRIHAAGTAELESVLERIRADAITQRTTSIIVLSRLLERPAPLTGGATPQGAVPEAHAPSSPQAAPFVPST